MRKWIANMISLSRLAIIVPWALCIGPRPLLAFLFICIVIATDLLDGPLARRLATTSELGASIDAYSDVAVCLTAMIILGVGDPRYFIVACAMIAAFASWILYRGLYGSSSFTRLGKYNGSLCYGLAVFASLGAWLERRGLLDLRCIATFLIGGVAIYLAASICENFLAITRTRRWIGAWPGGRDER